jgi:DNA polymerase I
MTTLPEQTGVIFRNAYTVKDGQLLLHVLGRDTNGERIDRFLTGTQPYFYVPEEEAHLAGRMPEVVKTESGPPCTNGRAMTKVVTRYPYDVPEVRKRFSFHAEADILFSTRTRIDHRLSYSKYPAALRTLPVGRVQPLDKDPGVKPRILYLDIEVNDGAGRFATPADAFAEIISITIKDNYTNQYGIIYTGPTVNIEKVKAELPGSAGGLIKLYPAKTEHDLLGMFGSLMRSIDPDIIEAWNGDGYDFPYIGARTKRLLLHEPANDDFQQVVWTFDNENERRSRARHALLDPMAVMKKQELAQGDHSLQGVGIAKLGIGKLERTGSVAELFRTNIARGLAYNLWDVRLLSGIDEKEKLTPYFLGIANVMGVEVDDCYYNSRVVDGALLQEARRTPNGQPYICLPSKQFAPGSIRRGRAAETFDVIPALHEWVAALDLSQEYPSIMLTFNISPETRVPQAIPGKTFDLPTGGHYLKEPDSLMRRALLRFREMRLEVKREVAKWPVGSPEREKADTISKAIKFVVNSVAGVFDDEHWRLANVETFEDITGMSRLQLRWNRDHIEDPAWLTSVCSGPWCPVSAKVVMGDTDSCYFTLQMGQTKQPMIPVTGLYDAVERIKKALNASYTDFFAQYGVTGPHYTEVATEGVFERLRTLPLVGSDVGARKLYYGLYASKEGVNVEGYPFWTRVKLSGIGAKRFNVAPISKSIQKAVIEKVLTGQTASVMPHWRMLRESAMAGKMDEDLMIPSKFSNAVDKVDENGNYKVNRPDLNGIRNAMTMLGIRCRPGDAMKWAYVNGVELNGQHIDTDVMAVPLLADLASLKSSGITLKIDRKQMVERCIDRAVELVYPEIHGKSARLEDGF